MAAKRIRIEVCGNSNLRKFHVTAQVSAEELRGGSILGATRHDPFKTFLFSEERKELGDDTKATIMRLYDIDGIASVGLKSFEMSLERSPAYEWEELESEIISAIKQIVNWQDEDVEIDYLFFKRVYPDGVSREVYENEMEQRRRAYERDAARFGSFR